jgi:hypothetical protein
LPRYHAAEASCKQLAKSQFVNQHKKAPVNTTGAFLFDSWQLVLRPNPLK